MAGEKSTAEEQEDDDTTESMSLEQLNGAVLTWTDADGTKRRVEFDE